MGEVCFIVPTYNMAEHLALTLQHIAEQRTAHDIRVVVSDDGSIDDTVATARRCSDRLNLSYLHRGRDVGSGRARARNVALATARGDVVVLVDSGVCLPVNFVEALMTAHGEHRQSLMVWQVLGLEAAGMMTACIRDYLAGTTSIAEVTAKCPAWGDPRLRFFTTDGDLGALPAPWALAWGCLMSFPAQFASIVSFDEGYVGWGAEDTEFALSMMKAGLRIRNGGLSVAGVHLPHRSVDATDRSNTHDKNRMRTHRKHFTRATEVMAITSSLEGNALLLWLDRVLEHEMLPRISRTCVESLNAFLAEGLRSAVLCSCGYDMVAGVHATHMFLMTKKGLPGLGASEMTQYYELLGALTNVPDGYFDRVAVFPGVQILPPLIRVSILREALRVAKVRTLVTLPREAFPDSCAPDGLGWEIVATSEVARCATLAGWTESLSELALSHCNGVRNPHNV